MAVVIFNGNPGDVYTNDTQKIVYQMIVTFQNSCGVCIQYANAIGPWWPIPFHRGCRCRNRPIYPGDQAAPSIDFMAEIAALDPAQQTIAVGKSNWQLIEAGAVTWKDVVTPNRVRTLEEVVSRNKLSINTMVNAGVKPYIAQQAHQQVNTPAHQLQTQHQQALVAALEGYGLSRNQITTAIAQGVAARVSIGGGPSGRQSFPITPVVPTPPKPPTPPPAPKPAPKPKPKPKPAAPKAPPKLKPYKPRYITSNPWDPNQAPAIPQPPPPLPKVEPPKPQPSAPIEPRHILDYINQLLDGPYADSSLIPIHELRKLVEENHGPEAASPKVFDKLVRQMRSESQLRTIAISDNRDATQEQLNKSIPGLNETIFYIARPPKPEPPTPDVPKSTPVPNPAPKPKPELATPPSVKPPEPQTPKPPPKPQVSSDAKPEPLPSIRPEPKPEAPKPKPPEPPKPAPKVEVKPEPKPQPPPAVKDDDFDIPDILKEAIARDAAKEIEKIKAADAAEAKVGQSIKDSVKVPNSEFGEKCKPVLDAIESVHKFEGTVANVPILAKTNFDANGELQLGPDRKPKEIVMGYYGDTIEHTLAHEIGHLIDFGGLPERGAKHRYWDQGLTAEWMSAVQSSKAFNKIVDAYDLPYLDLGNGQRSTKSPKDMVYYLAKPEECFARSYAQWVTIRSKNETMQGQLDHVRNQPINKALPSQWDDDDFEPIAKALDGIFDKLGWLKK